MIWREYASGSVSSDSGTSLGDKEEEEDTKDTFDEDNTEDADNGVDEDLQETTNEWPHPS